MYNSLFFWVGGRAEISLISKLNSSCNYNFFFPQGKKDLVAVDSAENDDDNGELRDGENDETDNEAQENSSSDVDSDEERRRLFLISCSIDDII